MKKWLEAMMLNQWLEWMLDNPAQAWRVSVTLLFLEYLLVRRITPDFSISPVSLLFVIPTLLLLVRFSAKQQKARPLAPHQWQEVGILSVQGAVCSVLVIGLAAVCQTLRISLPTLLYQDTNQVFSAALMLSILFGYIARKTRAGQWTLGIFGGGAVLLTLWAVAMTYFNLR